MELFAIVLLVRICDATWSCDGMLLFVLVVLGRICDATLFTDGIIIVINQGSITFT
jgi:hypothetical protein